MATEKDDQAQGSSWAAPRAAGASAAATLGPLTYAFLRHRRLSSDPALRRIQEASKGQLTRVLHDQAPTQLPGLRGKIQNAWNRLVHAGGGNVVHTGGMYEPQTFEGAVRLRKPSDAMYAKGDVNVGSGGAAVVSNLADSKVNEAAYFAQHAPGAMPRSKNLDEIMSDVPATLRGKPEYLDEMKKRLQQHFPSGFVLKETGGAQSSGMFPHEGHDFNKLLQEYREAGLQDKFWRAREAARGKGPSAMDAVYSDIKQHPAWSGRVLEEAVSNPYNVLAQEKVPIQKTTGLAKVVGNALHQPSSKEYRVHVEGGAVVPELTVPRFNAMGVLGGSKEKREAEEFARKTLAQLPPEAQTSSYAMDVAPLEGGGHRLIESNPGGESGLLTPQKNPFSGIKMFKGLTGQYSKPVAAIGAGAAALGGGALAATVGPSAYHAARERFGRQDEDRA
jgi:hypothetical protein